MEIVLASFGLPLKHSHNKSQTYSEIKHGDQTKRWMNDLTGGGRGLLNI